MSPQGTSSGMFQKSLEAEEQDSERRIDISERKNERMKEQEGEDTQIEHTGFNFFRNVPSAYEPF